MAKTKILLALLSITLFTACKKDYTVASPFTGITVTDVNAAPIGFIDSSDWTFTDAWQAYENDLFPSVSNLSILCTPSINLIASAFPNPCQQIGNLTFRIPTTSRISIKLINEQFKVILNMQNIAPDNLGYINRSISFSQLSIQDQVIRAYYVVTDSTKNCVLKGHGDILVE